MMPTGSGTLSLGSFSILSAGSVPQPDAGPLSTRSSTVFFEVRFSGNYSDEFQGEKLAEINWNATGFKFTEIPGNGQSAGGQSNRFWKRTKLRIESMSSVLLDMYSYLSLDAGTGFGQDQLGLGIRTKENTMLILRNQTGGGDLRIGGAPQAPWEKFIDGTLLLKSGYAMFAATQNQDAWEINPGVSQYLKLASTGGACIVDIYIGGRDFV